MTTDNPNPEPVDNDATEEVEGNDEVLNDETEESQDTSEQSEEENESELPEELDDEIEGVKLKGTKEQLEKLRNGVLMQADYTRKTQEVAEERKVIQTQREEFGKHVQFQQKHFAECAQLYNLSEQIKQYEAVDMMALFQQDPDQARQLDWQRNQLVKQRDELMSQVTQRSEHEALQTQQASAKRTQEAMAFLEREIKGWAPSNELDIALNAYAVKEYGVSGKELSEFLTNNPRLGKALHKAYQFDQLKAKQAKPKPTPQEKPVTRITAGKGKAVSDPSQMTDKQFAEWRKRQIAQRA